MQRNSQRAINPALSQGIIFGVAFGAVCLAYNLLNNLLNLDATSADVLNKLLIVTLLVSSGLVGLRVAHETGEIDTGILAAVVASVVSSAIGLATLWIITFAFMDIIRHNTIVMEAAVQARQYQNMDKLIVDDAIGASFFAPMLSITLAAGLGTLGALIGKLRLCQTTASQRRNW
jgi:hypothetical protein